MQPGKVEDLTPLSAVRAIRDVGGPLGPRSALFGRLHDFPGKVKGAAALALLNVLEDELPGRMDEFRDQFVPEYRQILEEGILPSNWYPEVFVCALLRARDRLKPPSTIEENIRYGRRYFQYMTRKYHHFFFRLAGPNRLLSACSRFWRLYHSVGQLILEERKDHMARGRSVGNPAILEPSHTEAVLGCLWEALALSKAENLCMRFERQPPQALWVEFRWGP